MNDTLARKIIFNGENYVLPGQSDFLGLRFYDEKINIKIPPIEYIRFNFSRFWDCVFQNCHFYEVSFVGVRFYECKFIKCSFSSAYFRGSEFRGCEMDRYSFEQAKIGGYDLPEVFYEEHDLPDPPRSLWKSLLYDMQKTKCNGCEQSFCMTMFDMDHIHPKAKGGEDSFSNIQLLCKMCNRIKGVGTHNELKEKLKSRGYPIK